MINKLEQILHKFYHDEHQDMADSADEIMQLFNEVIPEERILGGLSNEDSRSQGYNECISDIKERINERNIPNN